jgi:hypothetical protein
MPKQPKREQSIDEILAAARGFLSRRHVADDAAAAEKHTLAEGKEIARLKEESRVAPVIGRAAMGAALPAAFLGGPVGMAAGGALALEGLRSATGPGDVGLASLGAVPFLGPVSRALRRGKKAATAVVERFAPNISGAGRGASTWSAPGEADDSVQALNRVVEKYMPNTPARSGGGYGEAAMPFSRTIDDIDRYTPNTPGKVSSSYGDEALSLRGSEDLVNAHTPTFWDDVITRNDYMPPTRRPPSIEVLDDAPAVSQGMPKWSEAIAANEDLVSQLKGVPQAKRPFSNSEDFLTDAMAEARQMPESLQAIMDPRRMLPPRGATSETASPLSKTRTLMPDRTTLDLVNSLLPASARVKTLKQIPMPPGSDDVSKALRQRAHIEAGMAKRR